MKKLYGLVVCGGQSSRMGTDKSLLEYYNLPQKYYLYNLLKPLCDKVSISCNPQQATGNDELYKTIIDEQKYSNIGPMAALLSACHKYPDVSFLVVGCDYPFINLKDLKKLIENRKDETLSVCYYNPETDFEEPLLAIYENNCFPELLKNFEQGHYSLRLFLKSIHTKKIIPESLESLISVDTIEQYEETLLKLKGNSKN